MQPVIGCSLKQIVDDNGPPTFDAAANYVRLAADHLASFDKQNSVRLDLSPSSVVLAFDGLVHFLESPLGRHGNWEPIDDSLEIDALGAADYLAPEAALSCHRADQRADIYSLGCILYFLLTGQAPFPEGTLAERLLKHQNEEPRPIRELRPHVPDGLAKMCMIMMAKRPEHRYQTADELVAKLTAWMEQSG